MGARALPARKIARGSLIGLTSLIGLMHCQASRVQPAD
jgi:hypothetical protein